MKATDAAEPIGQLVRQLGRLPGVGERSAARLATYIIRASCPGPAGRAAGRDLGDTLADDLAAALTRVAREVGMCERCGNLCAGPECAICADPRRHTAMLCVVEGVAQLQAIEGSGAHRGLYHVLHGALSPLDGIGPEQLNIGALVARVRAGGVQEVLVATGANVEGDTTALYLARLLLPLGPRLTRLASGVPLGGELEYLDHNTLGRAIRDRRPL